MFNKINLLTFLFCVMTFLSYGQNRNSAASVVEDSLVNPRTAHGLSMSKERQKADETYNDLGYKESVEMYHRLKQKDAKTLRRIANSYRLNDEPENAAYWYSKFIQETDEAEDYWNYAKVLQSVDACEDAIRWYEKYKSVADKKEVRHREFITDCAEVNTFEMNDFVEVSNVEILNGKHLDFSPVVNEEGIIFTSTRGVNSMKKRKDKWTKDNFSDLFIARKNEDGTYGKPEPLFGSINGDFHDGTATFNQYGNVMFFTRNNNKGKSKKGLIDLKIYSAMKNEDGYWASIEELPFNSDEFTSCHPTLSKDGRRLYFASNRPGGYGGLDIYVVESMYGGWSEPRNLGPTVNSSDNEVFPFIGQDETLYFASKGHKGLGGLDIFMAQKVDKEDEGSWSVRENMGHQFNTKKDDFGFWISEDKTHGYLSSSRHDGNGGDDIYEWKSEDNLFAMGGMAHDFCTFESGGGKRISKAEVTIQELEQISAAEAENVLGNDNLMLVLKPISEGSQEYVLSVVNNQKNKKYEPKVTKIYTNEEGSLVHKIKPGKVYELTAKKKGYEDATITMSYDDLVNSNNSCIPMIRKTCMTLNGLVVNKDYDKPMPGATVKVENKCTGEINEYVVEKDGAFDFCVECGCEYRIVGQKSGFDSDIEFVYPKSADCNPELPLTTRLELGTRKVISRTTDVVPATPTPSYETPTPPTPSVQYVPQVTYVARTIYEPVTTYVPMNTADLNNHFIGDPTGNYREGMLINLKDVYYDFDKFNIRLDASKDLDRLLQLMNTYPSLAISLEAHTDSRGSSVYNQQLSTNRANAARTFLIERGIAAERIKARGFGESRLRNRCADGVECSKEEHQANRRTEVRVLRFEG